MTGWDILSSIGNTLSAPGDYLRGALAGKFDRLSGRDLLEHYGIVDKNQEGLDAGDVAGFVAEMALDPLNLVGAAGIKNAAARLAKIKAFNRESQIMRAAGAMPEELVSKLHPSMLDDAGRPRTFYHGTEQTGLSARQLDPALTGTRDPVGDPGWIRGVSFTPDREVAKWQYGGPAGNVVESHIAGQNPYVTSAGSMDTILKRGGSYLSPEDAASLLRAMGHDSVSYRPGVSHLANETIALDPSIIFDSKVAPALKKHPKELRNRLALLAAYNAMQGARQ